jgi:FlaG/FlaF family flagellin (archaellin)
VLAATISSISVSPFFAPGSKTGTASVEFMKVAAALAQQKVCNIAARYITGLVSVHSVNKTLQLACTNIA